MPRFPLGRQAAVLALVGGLSAGTLASTPVPLPVPVPVLDDPGPAAGYRTTTLRWRAADDGMAEWPRASVDLNEDGALALDPYRAAGEFDRHPGSYHGRNYHNGAHFVTGEAMSPLTPVDFPFSAAIASWDVDTPPGSWIEMQLRVRMGQSLTKFFSLGVWASDDSTVEPHSVDRQGDPDGDVTVDTLTLAEGVTADAVQLRVMFHTTRPDRVPRLHNAAVTLSSARPEAPPAAGGPEGGEGTSAAWGHTLEVPDCRVPEGADPDRGWSTAAATTMLLRFWDQRSACTVEEMATGVDDWVGGGYGHLGFNAAAGRAAGLEGTVLRFTSLAGPEAWLAAGIPLALSRSPRSGHVLVGFAGNGDPVLQDPTAPAGTPAAQPVSRRDLEREWLTAGGGTAWVLHPPGAPFPR
jgi:hypothetical protein